MELFVRPLGIAKKIAGLLFLAFCLCAGRPLMAHPLNATQVEVTITGDSQFKAVVYVDFGQAFGSADAYYEFSLLRHSEQEKRIRELLIPVLAEMQFKTADQAVKMNLADWELPQASRKTYNDYYIGKMTRLDLVGTLPPERAIFSVKTTEQSTLEFPIVVKVERPDLHIQSVDWIETPGDASEAVNYDGEAAPGDAILKSPIASPLPGAEMFGWQRFWYVKLGTLTHYLGLGFHHIVPDGADHILFVLGLFFLGISWRKILAQTTVFTIAHATTLYLSTQNIFSLPSWFVEPCIALSIMFIALENVFSRTLSRFRLSVVFCFGLIHGLGFASDLKTFHLPPHEFIMALLGFNFGVDFGQLFVVLLAFILVGPFRNLPSYTTRIAIPSSCFIAVVGGFWAMERILFYAHLSTL